MIHKFAILSVLFHRNFQKGQTYIHRNYINSKNPLIVEILEVHKHIIHFKHISNSLYVDEYATKSSFNFTFQLLKENKK